MASNTTNYIENKKQGNLVAEELHFALKVYGSRPLFGWRKQKSVDSKAVLGENYEWITYNDVFEQSKRLGNSVGYSL